VFGKLIGTERPREKSALVVVGFDVDNGDPVDGGASPFDATRGFPRQFC
jgi:hypothetical protein